MLQIRYKVYVLDKHSLNKGEAHAWKTSTP